VSADFPKKYVYRTKWNIFWYCLFFLFGGVFLLAESFQGNYAFEVFRIKFHGTAGYVAKVIVGTLALLMGTAALAIFIKDRLNPKPVILGEHSLSVPNQLGSKTTVVLYREIDSINVNISSGTIYLVVHSGGKMTSLSRDCFVRKELFYEFVEVLQEKQSEIQIPPVVS
jgi:hypothetical protein